MALALQVCAAAKVEAQTALPESIPDFSQDATRVKVQSVASGSWSSPSTWQGGQVPTANQIVRILQAHTVTIDNTSAAAYTVSVDGTLKFAPTVNSALYVTNLQVMAGDMGMGTPGVLELGTAANPIASNVTAQITIANNPLGGSVADPDQFGTGITVFGKVSMHGSVRTPTFVRVATEPRAGQSTLTLSAPVTGWQVGDRIILPDTRHLRFSDVDPIRWTNTTNQWEELTVQAISGDGRTLTLNLPLQYDHLGARDLNGVLEFLPHVGNLTRNVIVRSENPAGTRGHLMAIHMAEADIRYALFKDLGRTTYLPLNPVSNHIGRYPIHVHHLIGPSVAPANGFQFTLLGNAVDGGSVETQFKWGVTVHGSHYGSIQDNVVYNYNGAAIATEDGSESFNEFDHNFAVRGIGEPDEPGVQARMAMGTEGVGFWFRGPNNFVRNNVAANFQNPTAEAAYGFVYQFIGLGPIAIPPFKGADTMGMHGPVQAIIKDGNNVPLLQFENNEAYGAMQGGLTYWWVSSQDPVPSPNPQESVIRNFRAWHIYNKTVYVYPGQKVTIDGLKIRGKFAADSHCCGDGVWFEDYSTKDTLIRNADIQGMEDGIQAPSSGFGPGPNLRVENSYLRNWRNINVPTPSSVNGCWMDDKLITITNTRFDAPPGRVLSAINMVGKANGVECLGKLDEVRVYAYNGNAADNFQIYHPRPAVLPRPPAGCAPVAVPGIAGLIPPDFVAAGTCSLAAIVAPAQISSPAAGSTLTSSSQLFTWSTGVGVASYQLSVGTSAGGSDIYSGAPVNITSALVAGLPTHGGVIWVRLFSNIDGAWQYIDTSYTATGVPLFFDLAPGSVVSVEGNEAQTTPPFDAAAGDLLVAFVASSSPANSGQTMTVSGGGLTWSLVKRANTQFGVSEIWKATPAVALSGITITSTPTQSSPSQSLVVMSFSGTGGIGASAAASGPLGGPSVSLTATKTGSFVFGVGNDWNGSVSRTLGSNQTMVHEYLGLNGDTFWVQRLTGTVPLIGTLITLNDSAPTDHSWNFAAVEILPIQRVPPPITWPTPANITFGTALDDAQLNATTTVAGSFVYDPPAGTILNAGQNQTLSVTFTPANMSTIFGPATATVPLNVLKAPAFVTWFSPADISYGVALGPTQLNATASVPGSFVYSPPAGTVLSAGNGQTLSVTFTPDDPNYQTVVTAVSLNVATTTPVVIWNVPAPIIFGTALGGGQLNASAGVPGTFVYTPAAGTVLAAGSRTLSVTFTPTDTAFAPSTRTVPLTVLKATPIVTWATPANIVSGTALSATQLNAVVGSPAGTLAYVPAAGTVLPVGPAQRLSVTFTPTDTANYNIATAAVPITVISVAVGAPVKIGNTIAGTFSDATGHSGQSHLVFAPNAGVWWLFTLSSAHDTLGDRTVQSYVSSGPDLATATWTAKNVSPTLGNAGGATNSVLAGGRSLGVAVRTVGTTDYAHVFVSSAFDGQVSSNGHARATLGATTINWGPWNNPGSPNTASEWQGPLGSGNAPSAAATHTSWGNSIGISSGGFIHHFSVTMDQEVDCAVGRSTNADTAASWTNGFGSNVSPTGQAGSSPPWTTAVIDKTMANECKAMAFAPLASDFMLAVYTNGMVPQPNITNLRYMKSGANGTWTNISASTGGGNGNVFSSVATISQNDWALVPVNTTTVHAFRRKADGTGIDGASYSTGGNSWSAISVAPPTFGSGQAFKSGGGLFGATDGTNVWLFVINTDTANSILYTQFNGSSWTAWTTVPGTGVGSQTRNFITGNPAIGSGQAGLAWTQGTSTFDVWTTSLRLAASAAPATVSLSAPAAGSTVSATVNVSATATPGSGTVAGVQFLLDGVNLGAEDTVSPYSVAWDTTTATNGTHFLTAVARDSAGGTGTATTVAVTVANDLTAPTIVMTAPAGGTTVSGALVSVSAEAFDDIGVAGVQFLLDGVAFGAEDTTAPYAIVWDVTAASAGTHTLSAKARDAFGRLTTAASVSVTVASSVPSIVWPTPANIVYGTALSATQLNATSGVPGTFAYNPAAGTVLPAGPRTLSVTFTPADPISYAATTTTVPLTVLKATPVLTWAAPATITYGTVLSSTQLNASTPVAGSFAYNPVAGTVLPAGASQTLSVIFTPTDAANYATATKSVPITVLQATPAITWPAPASITYGTVLSATQLNASTPVPGTFAYTPVAGTVLPAGAAQTLSVTFTPSDAASYTTATASVAITVLRATPAITWPAPATITYGTVLGVSQLNASTSVPGTFAYTPAAGTVLPAGTAQSLSVTFTPSDAASYTTATASTTINVLQVTLTISWPNPSPITYGTAIGAAQLNASTTAPGTFAYTPSAGTVLNAGARTLSVTFTPTDATNYAAATASVPLSVLQATPTITWNPPAGISYGAGLSSAQLNATANVPGTFDYTPAAGSVLTAGAKSLSVTFTPTDTANYTTATVSVPLDVAKGAPTITWPTPADIFYGAALGATQLNATAGVPGTFVYTPAAGTVLPVGAAQTVSVTFTPAEAANYRESTSSVLINVSKAAPVITWAPPANVVYGAALAAAQLNATANVPGTLVYTPAGGAMLDAGSHTLSVTFTPADAANYTSKTASVSFSVLKATPTITWPAPADITYGTAIDATQLNASASEPGTFAYTPAANALLSAGPQTLSVTFTPTDASNYATATATVALTVARATTTITWAPPADIVYGTALGAAQQAATASVPGTFAYTPAAGAVIGAGTQTLSVTFTPTDATNYAAATATVTLKVTPAAPLITLSGTHFEYDTHPHAPTATATGIGGVTVAGSFAFSYLPGETAPINFGTYAASVVFTSADPNYSGGSGGITVTIDKAIPSPTWTPPASIVFGTPLGAAHLSAQTEIAGTYAYAPPAGTVLQAGTGRVLSVTFTPADANYQVATKSVSIDVLKAAPVVTWTAPADIVVGTALGPAPLNATADVAGTFVYTPAAGTVLPIGAAQTLSVTFTPDDAANYTSKTTTVAITVRGLPSITVSATNVGLGATITATVANGPANRTDWIALYATGGTTYLNWKYLNGTQIAPAVGLTGAAVPFALPTTPGTYVLKFFTGSTVLATTATITVASPTLTVSTTTVTAGGSIVATVANGPGNAKDWVGVYSTNGSVLSDWKYLNGSQTSPATGVTDAAIDLTMPTIPGTYTVRLYFNEALLANSAVITVGSPSAPTLTVSTTTVTPGGVVTATIANGPANARDWVGLSATGDATSLDWKYLNGTQSPMAAGMTSATVAFTMPTTPGTYLLRLYAGNTVLATGATITVATSTNTSLTVNTTVVNLGGVVTATVANGPSQRTDWIAIYPEGGATYSDWKYLNGLQIAPAAGLSNAVVPIAMPTTPGTYVLRLYTGATLVATSAIVTVASNTTITPNITLIAPGGIVTAAIANSPGNRSDWVALYAANSSTYVEWKYLNGSQVLPATGVTSAAVGFVMPTVPGTYTVRLYSGSIWVATSATITVGFTTTMGISATTVTAGGTVAVTVANGPGNPRDWVGLYASNGSTLLDWKYLSGSQVAPIQGLTDATVVMTMPSTTGAYTLRFATGSTILGTSPIVAVQ